MKGYYVTAMRGKRVAWLYGPFACHQLAISFIPIIRRASECVDPRFVFDAFGTSSITADELPQGTINPHLAKIIVDNGLINI